MGVSEVLFNFAYYRSPISASSNVNLNSMSYPHTERESTSNFYLEDRILKKSSMHS